MKINSITPKINFKAQLSKPIEVDVEKQGRYIWKNFGLDSYEFTEYKDSLNTVSKLFPDGKICYKNGDKNQVVLKHEGKKDIPLKNISPLFFSQSIASNLVITLNNISQYLEKEE